MDLPEFSKFISQCASDAEVNFTLDGERISPKDLGDANGLLPLVVASINHIHQQISGSRESVLTLLEQADPVTHLLGWRVKSLPAMPHSALLLLANDAIRQRLAFAPAPALEDITQPLPPATGLPSELRDHLEILGLSHNAPARHHAYEDALPG